MPLNEPDVSLIIPAFNEAARLPQSLRKIVEFTGGNAFSCEVLVVVEKSTDGTLELARETVAKQANFRNHRRPCVARQGIRSALGNANAKGLHFLHGCGSQGQGRKLVERTMRENSLVSQSVEVRK